MSADELRPYWSAMLCDETRERIADQMRSVLDGNYFSLVMCNSYDENSHRFSAVEACPSQRLRSPITAQPGPYTHDPPRARRRSPRQRQGQRPLFGMRARATPRQRPVRRGGQPMTLHTYPDLEQGSEEWLEARRGLITASVVGQLITPSTIRPASNDKSRALLAQLAAERITGRAEAVFVNDDMMRGNLHEPYARDRYAEHNGVDVQQVGFAVRDEWGIRLGASPDGFVGDGGGIEIKCPRAKAHIQTILSDEVPAYNMAQVQATLLVTGRDWWDFVSFCAGLPLFTKRVTLDQKWRDAIITAATTAEHAIGSMVRNFEAISERLPATEYIPTDFEMVI